MTRHADATRKILSTAPVIPVLVVENVSAAIPLAEALVSGGLPVLEVTLRTPAALDVIAAMQSVEGAIVGAGTLLDAKDAQASKEAGAAFGVSPGSAPDLLEACETLDLPLLPGAATATEVMHLRAKGYNSLKFFPAEASGGIAALKGIGGPIPDVGFCPTGGVGAQNHQSYLDLPNVICVGGSWIATSELIAQGNWDEIRARAKAASAA